MPEDYDFIIIGSGAGGAAAAYKLVSSGRRVLLIEKGRTLPKDDSTLDVDKVMRRALFNSDEEWLDRDNRLFRPGEFPNIGGKTKWYGAALLRFSLEEFAPDEGFKCLPWPVSYDDMAPFYEEAEALLDIKRFETEPDLKKILSGFQRKPCWRIEPLPMGLSREILDYPEEARHFDGFASPRGLKNDSEVAFLDLVKGRPNIEIITGNPVVTFKSEEGAPHRINGVVCRDGRVFKAKAVILAAGALHSPRILQAYMERYGLDRLPNCRLIGRYYKCHLNSALLAVSASLRTDLLRKTVIMFNDAFPHSSVQTLGWIDGDIISAQMPRYFPRLLSNMVGKRAYGFWLTTEDGSHPDNRVIATGGALRHPLLDYDASRLPASIAEHRSLIRTFRFSLAGLWNASFVRTMPLPATAHACGTLIAGDDQRESVVAGNGKVHFMENLYVVDGSVLPRISRVNPSLTIYAWALRVAERLTGC